VRGAHPIEVSDHTHAGCRRSAGRSIRRSSATGGDATISGMGFNPHRQYKRRPSDYVLVAVSLALVLALVAWGFLG